MTIISSGTLALQDAGANSGGTPTYFIDDTFTAGSATNKIIQGDFTEYDEETEEENTVTENLGSFTVYGYNQGTTSGTTVWRSGYNWNDISGGGLPWDDEGNIVPSSNLGAIGSGLTTTYTDGGGTSRTVVTAILVDEPNGADSGPDQYLMLGLAGTTAPDTDNTFKEFQWGGLTVSRGAADHVGTSNGCKFWIWELTAAQQTTAGASTGTKDFELIQSSGSTALNNGIAEEFGGADSADVKLSDYYKGAASGYVTTNVTASIPTSGQIKFSDFFGATYAAGNIHSTLLTNGNTGGYGFAQSGYFASSYGSISDATITNFNGSSTCSVTALYSNSSSSTATFGTLFLRIVNSSGSGASNAGFTTMKLWLIQNNNSGTPDYTFSRSTASYSGSGGTMTWSWSVSVSSSPYVYGTFFGGQNAYGYYMELV